MIRFFEYLAQALVRKLRPARAEVLELVNEARMALDLPPMGQLPAGITRDIEGCPIAICLPGMVGVDGVCFDRFEHALSVAGIWDTTVNIAGPDRFVVSLPTVLRHFVRDYDLGAFPSLNRSGDRPPIQRHRPFDDNRPARRAA